MDPSGLSGRDRLLTIMGSRLEATMELLKDRDLKLDFLQTSLAEKCQSLEDTKEKSAYFFMYQFLFWFLCSLIKSETRLADQSLLLQQLETEIIENRATLKKEYESRSKTEAEKDKAIMREESLVSEAITLRKSIEELKLK